MWQQQEQEWHAHQGEPLHRNGAFTIPQGNRAHHYDSEKTWTVEVYDRKLGAYMTEIGAVERPCMHDGRLFVVDAKQLIEFIAESSGLIVEFRQRRRKQLSEEQKQILRQRMATINAQRDSVLSTDNRAFSSLDSTTEGELILSIN